MLLLDLFDSLWQLLFCDEVLDFEHFDELVGVSVPQDVVSDVVLLQLLLGGFNQIEFFENLLQGDLRIAPASKFLLLSLLRFAGSW